VAEEVCEVFDAPPERVHAVAHGVDTVAGEPSAPPLVGHARFVLALGTVEPRKDLPLLVGAFDRIAAGRVDVRLVIAGPDGWGSGTLNAAVADAAHGDRIIRVGFVDRSQRAALLGGASVFAYPSRYEGFGLPVLEAMAAGTPVVTTSAGALPEVAGDAALLVPPGDVDALAGALATVLDDPPVAAEFAHRGVERAASFSWERCAAGLYGVYQAAAP
jgi:glycosyltransferase involved in cell wall biosynthesis